jgi:hypothetical protein
MRNLFEALQACHPFLTLPLIASSTTLSKSEFSKTINASFPPSSKTLGFRYFPARAPTALHAASLPVRLTHAIYLFDIICSLRLLETKTFVYTQAGNPAFSNNSSIFIAIIGTLELCLYI